VHTSDNEVVGAFDSCSIDLATTDVVSGAQLEFEGGNSERKIVDVDAEVLSVCVAIVHARLSREDWLRVVATIVNLNMVIKIMLLF